jgi:hypothetical protein
MMVLAVVLLSGGATRMSAVAGTNCCELASGSILPVPSAAMFAWDIVAAASACAGMLTFAVTDTSRSLPSQFVD